MSESFGFRVEVDSDDLWSVELPHQCDEWGIANVKYHGGVSHEVAVAELERFIAEATDALTALRERRTVGGES